MQSAMKKTNKPRQLVQAIAQSPFLWGVLGAAGFYVVLDACPADAEAVKLVKRYFTHHPVEYMETVMFAVGLAALVIKLFDVAAQRAGLSRPLLGPAPDTPQPIEQADRLLAQLEQLPERRRSEFYVARVKAALEHLARRGSADALDDELKYLSDMDAARQHAGYGLFRVIVWAIPILGFLGTVIGITMALNGVDMSAPEQSMRDVLNGLGLKFDTTALALTLAMVLMFVHFYVERADSTLLEQVDRRVQTELSDRFARETAPAGGDGQLLAARRTGEAVLQATESLVRRQAQLWQASVDAAAEHWATMAQAAAQHVGTAMSAATGDLARQTEVLRRAVEAAGEVVRLEDALNRNLAALAGAKHFEQTVLSLAAAVNMLGARLAESPGAAPVRLETTRRSVHAA
jgi:biopolymer transport protein ExbB/TolQ